MPNALINYYQSLQHFSAIKLIKDTDEKYISDVMLNIGVIYKDHYSYRNAINFYNMAIDIKKRLNDDFLLAETYRNLAKIYRLTSQYDSALIFNEKALNIYQTSNEKQRISVVFNEIGINLNLLGEYDNARRYFFDALMIVEGTEHELERRTKTYQNAAKSYHLESDLGKAKNYYSLAIQRKRSIPGYNYVSIMNSLNEMGNIFLLQNDPDSAKFHYTEALALTDNNDFLNIELKIATEGLMNIALQKGDIDHAFKLSQQLVVIKSEIISDQQDFKKLY